MAKALIRFPGRLEELTTTEMKHSIREANLGKDDTRIAELYLLERKPQIDVADCCEIDRKTRSSRPQSWAFSKKVHNAP